MRTNQSNTRDRLVFFDVDGTTVDAFHAIDLTFQRHGMNLGDLERFQKRRNILKYLGGLREFPKNLRRQFGKQSRKKLLNTLTEVYRHEARLFPGMDTLLRTVSSAPGIRMGVISRNVTHEPEETLKYLFRRHDIDPDAFDFFTCIPVRGDKSIHMKQVRESFSIHPARAYACGDEHSDYLAAIRSGIHPFIVSYGFEDFDRLTKKFEVPAEVISTSPEAFIGSLRHALDLTTAT
ncbi:MAG TPA: HAD hydrolase-like protein [Mariprofundaceae bacterium]|nr:HAD hydrolase-like protein [Mariprofundaceae bacterium]